MVSRTSETEFPYDNHPLSLQELILSLIFQSVCVRFDGMITSDIITDSHKYIMNTYSRQPIVLVKGRGTKVYDSDGREYLDFVSGVAVNNLGHCHPACRRCAPEAGAAAHACVEPLPQRTADQSREDARQSTRSPTRSFFCNSGTEAIEAAIKLARRYSREVLNQDRYEIITMRGSFHGRTMGRSGCHGPGKVSHRVRAPGPRVPVRALQRHRCRRSGRSTSGPAPCSSSPSRARAA